MAIGFRVRSKRGTQFRIWANKNLNKRLKAKRRNDLNKHQVVTRNIRKPGNTGKFNFSTFTQYYIGSTSLSFEIPVSVYFKPLTLKKTQKPQDVQKIKYLSSS